jgi:Sec-independent protein translocase protein TatA
MSLGLGQLLLICIIGLLIFGDVPKIIKSIRIFVKNISKQIK